VTVHGSGGTHLEHLELQERVTQAIEHLGALEQSARKDWEAEGRKQSTWRRGRWDALVSAKSAVEDILDPQTQLWCESCESYCFTQRESEPGKDADDA
jgi:hypothetical protein